jgi:integrase
VGPVRAAIANPQFRTLAQAVAEHLSETAKDLAPGTRDDRRRELQRLQDHFGPSFDVGDFTEKAIRLYVGGAMRGKGKKKTLERRFSNLRVFFDWLSDLGYMPFRLPEDAKNAAIPPRAKDDSESSEPWPEGLILELLQDPKVRPTIKTLAIMRLYSGCRPEALASLEVERVEADRMRIIGDKNHPRTIPIHPVVQPLYAALKANAREPWLIPGQKPGGKNQTREFHIGKDVGRWLKMRKDAGTLTAKCTWYGLRHTFVTRWRNDLNLRLEIMQELIGQKPERISVADKHYRSAFTIERLAAELKKFHWPEAIEAECISLSRLLPDAIREEKARSFRAKNGVEAQPRR